MKSRAPYLRGLAARAALGDDCPRRAHQIRVQLSAHGLPIVGDVKYGAQSRQPGRIALHAAALTFDHPIQHKPVTVRAPEPGAWEQWFGLPP